MYVRMHANYIASMRMHMHRHEQTIWIHPRMHKCCIVLYLCAQMHTCVHANAVQCDKRAGGGFLGQQERHRHRQRLRLKLIHIHTINIITTTTNNNTK